MDWKTIGIFCGMVVVWVGLSRWVLPMCGIQTCCSGRQCQLPPDLNASVPPAAPELEKMAPSDPKTEDSLPNEPLDETPR